MEIGSGLAAAKAGFDLIKQIRDLVKKEKPDPQEILDNLVQLQNLLLEAREALADAQDQNRSLKSQIDDQNAQKRLAEDMEYVQDGGYYIRKSERSSGKNIPYCRLCWTKDGKTVTLSNDGEGYFHCDHDKSNYETNAYRNRENSFL